MSGSVYGKGHSHICLGFRDNDIGNYASHFWINSSNLIFSANHSYGFRLNLCADLMPFFFTISSKLLNFPFQSFVRWSSWLKKKSFQYKVPLWYYNKSVLFWASFNCITWEDSFAIALSLPSALIEPEWFSNTEIQQSRQVAKKACSSQSRSSCPH